MQLLNRFAETNIAKAIGTLWLVGANKFEERDGLYSLFPNLQKVYLFEPIAEVFQWLRREFPCDSRVEILPYALSDCVGSSDFFISNNSVSSSLLPLGRHLDFFPSVKTVRRETVEVRSIKSLLENDHLDAPNLLFIDAQGAELKILRGIPVSVLGKILIIHLEASLEELYVGSGTLDDIKKVLRNDFTFWGFKPMSDCAIHGDALFLNKNVVSLEVDDAPTL